MRWATRAGVHIDRAACAWLLRRFIDADASFVFVDDPAEVPADATAFDMRGVELGHHGGDCSFETILRRYELEDPVLWKLAELVHEADLDDERFDAPEARGLDMILRGLSMTCDDLRAWRAGHGAGRPDPARAGLWAGRGPARRGLARPRAGRPRSGAGPGRHRGRQRRRQPGPGPLGRPVGPRPQLWVAVWGADRSRPADRRRGPGLAAGPGRPHRGAVDRGGR